MDDDIVCSAWKHAAESNLGEGRNVPSRTPGHISHNMKCFTFLVVYVLSLQHLLCYAPVTQMQIVGLLIGYYLI
uniref:Uncharacterized protein n=1 Tax=Klebsiella phage FKP3 TaxID=3231233 RepID=A0AAU8HZI7_9CAUD